MPEEWRLRLAGCREPWRATGASAVGSEEALSAPELSAGGGCGANSINALHPGRFGLIQREMLQETVIGVFSSALG